ncbi:MAG: tRNA (adenosine(37)-N6)-threonylcarbamoyltransferase complex ATPase subunit type 1 TsaE [bacterium]
MCDNDKATILPKYKRDEKSIISNSPAETQRIGEQWGRSLQPGSVVALFGELGSGKTTFIKGVCRGLNVIDEITSPSFTLIHEYTGKIPIYHFDFYRIENIREILELGCEDYFYRAGICLIEWADRVTDFLPSKRIEIYLKHRFNEGAEQSRQIFILKL